jgi:hypothetical protein
MNVVPAINSVIPAIGSVVPAIGSVVPAIGSVVPAEAGTQVYQRSRNANKLGSPPPRGRRGGFRA